MKKSVSVILALIMLFMLTGCSGGSDDTQQPEADGVLASFTTVDIEGNNVDQKIFKGKKITMVNLWTTYCVYCIKEMPDLQKLSVDYADKGFQVVGIVCDQYLYTDAGYDDTLLNEAKEIVTTTGIKYPTLLPSESLINAKLGEVYSVPETIFVDENGNQIGSSYIGSKSYEDWAAIIDGIINSL